MYTSSKTYGHEQGLSCCFRQWRAEHSHCHFLHGYALSVHIEFQAEQLNELNWVVDFGMLKSFKAQLADLLDHKTIIAQDDPMYEELMCLEDHGLAQIVVLPHVGCEAFAEHIYHMAENWLAENKLWSRVKTQYVRVAEHGGNAATYRESGNE